MSFKTSFMGGKKHLFCYLYWNQVIFIDEFRENLYFYVKFFYPRTRYAFLFVQDFLSLLVAFEHFFFHIDFSCFLLSIFLSISILLFFPKETNYILPHVQVRISTYGLRLPNFKIYLSQLLTV